MCVLFSNFSFDMQVKDVKHLLVLVDLAVISYDANAVSDKLSSSSGNNFNNGKNSALGNL